jgi:hypothetical protein
MKNISFLAIICIGLSLIIGCKKDSTEFKNNSNILSYSKTNSDSLNFDPSRSDPRQIYATHILTAGRFTFTCVHLGLIDSGMIFLPYKDKNVFESFTVKGDNDVDFPVVFDQKDKRIGRFAMNWVINEINTYGTLNFTVVFKRLNVAGTPNPYPSGTDFSFAISGIKAHGVWYQDSAWSDTYKLAGSKPHVELTQFANSIEPPDQFTVVARLRLSATGGWVLYDSLQVVLTHFHAAIDAGLEIIDSVNSSTLGTVSVKTSSNMVKANIKFFDIQHPAGIKIKAGAVHTYYLLARITKKENGYVVVGLGDPAKMGWHDNTGKPFNNRTYFLSSTDYTGQEIILN